MDYVNSKDVRADIGDDKRSKLRDYLIKHHGNSEADNILDKLASTARDLASGVMAQAGMSKLHWRPCNAKVICTPVNTPQGEPMIWSAAPCYQAFMHLSCCSEKVLVYGQKDVPPGSAAEHIGLPKVLGAVDVKEAMKIVYRRPGLEAHVSRSANLCQPREELEAALVPWGDTTVDPWSSTNDVIILRGEDVIALPPRPKLRPTRECHPCKDDKKGALVFHVDFVPRGGMAATFDEEMVTRMTPWEVATVKAIFPHLIEDDEQRRAIQTHVMQPLLKAYPDCTPHSVFKDEKLKKDAAHFMKKIKRAKAPTAAVKKCRFQWPSK